MKSVVEKKVESLTLMHEDDLLVVQVSLSESIDGSLVRQESDIPKGVCRAPSNVEENKCDVCGIRVSICGSCNPSIKKKVNIDRYAGTGRSLQKHQHEVRLHATQCVDSNPFSLFKKSQFGGKMSIVLSKIYQFFGKSFFVMG